MTCILGVVSGHDVYIGADSASVSDLNVYVRSDSKVFTVGDAVIGFAGSFRMGQLLRYKLKVPRPAAGDDIMRYMVVHFVEAVRSCLADGGFGKMTDGEHTGGCFLVGIAGRLFCVESDFQVAEHANGLHAIGCGAHYALGAISALRCIEPEFSLMSALETAAEFSAGVCAPFTIKKAPALFATATAARRRLRAL